MNYSEYQASLRDYVAAHVDPSLSTQWGGPQAEVSGGGNRASDQAQERNYDDSFNAWRGGLSPEQQQEYKSVTDEHYAQGTKRARLAALAAFGGVAGAGALGAGAAGGGAGAGAVPSFAGNVGGLSLGGGGLAAEAGLASGAAGLGDAATAAAWGSGAGLGADTLSAMGAAGGGGSWLSSLGALGKGSNLLQVGGNLLGSYLSSNAANKAVDAQLQGGRESNALATRIYDQSRADAAPYRAAGVSALEGIQALLKNPGSITSDPGYQFGMDQGTRALNSGAASRGMTYSGAQGKALQRYGNDYAGTKLDQSFNRLASVAGIGQTANTVGAATGQNYANNTGQTLQGMGNARGSGYVGAGTAWNEGIGNSLSAIQNDELMRRKYPNGGW